MRNIDVIKGFFHPSLRDGDTKSVHVLGDRLFSYSTCICQRGPSWGSDTYIYNATKYSVTTSKMQTYILQNLIGNYVYIVRDIPAGCLDLSNYVKGNSFLLTTDIINKTLK